MKQSYPMDIAQGLDIDLEALLAPVPMGEGAGVSLRYEPLYQHIRDARTHDDSSVPMGEWERPLIKADWKRVAASCTEALSTRSKDFQLAAWLCEAWTHMHRIEGFIAGTRLLTMLAESYWEHAWPALEEGDTDARVAPFVWLNDTIALVLTLHVPLLVIEGREPANVNLDEWQRVLVEGGDDDAADLTRDLLDKHVTQGGNLASLAALHQQLEVAQQMWLSFGRLLDVLLQGDSPHLGRVSDVLMRLSRAVTSLLGNHALAAATGQVPHDDPAAGLMAVGGAPSVNENYALLETQMSDALREPPVVGTSIRALPARVESRAQAYQLIEVIAQYLAEQEPHSPTPYLLRRAASWGQMPLPELMREVLRTEGDMSRYLAMLEIK
ncbi:type VI secretion system protein TssA [Paraburkholderia phymatum]|uniref:Type VI secretion-associated protein, ImpA family n=1 Tax=Paraburkholderia phymatum (strain DSM 17167 / CIP 108236 / LMG 21445 / STM815) TaxID=391038 RepID=B2JVT3_PARP8|nr:type VI secretion system protein TssA [Paraburkholderia phymatum]ACC75060.1 type VI secretion-associated protein, ImpA family [Paraburkholderia phymatum STM815]